MLDLLFTIERNMERKLRARIAALRKAADAAIGLIQSGSANRAKVILQRAEAREIRIEFEDGLALSPGAGTKALSEARKALRRFGT